MFSTGKILLPGTEREYEGTSSRSWNIQNNVGVVSRRHELGKIMLEKKSITTSWSRRRYASFVEKAGNKNQWLYTILTASTCFDKIFLFCRVATLTVVLSVRRNILRETIARACHEAWRTCDRRTFGVRRGRNVIWNIGIDQFVWNLKMRVPKKILKRLKKTQLVLL